MTASPVSIIYSKRTECGVEWMARNKQQNPDPGVEIRLQRSRAQERGWGQGAKKTKGERAQEKCEKFYSNFNCLKSKWLFMITQSNQFITQRIKTVGSSLPQFIIAERSKVSEAKKFIRS